MNKDNLRVHIMVGVEDTDNLTTPVRFDLVEVKGADRIPISTALRSFRSVLLKSDPEAFTEWERRTCNECIDAAIAANTPRMGTRTHP